MKKLLSILVLTLLSNIVVAQVSKTINVPTAGTLTTLLTTEEKSTITDLTVTGNIDARDFRCLRDEVTNLSVLDLSAVNIKAYNGTGGSILNYAEYPENELPFFSFFSDDNNNIGKLSLTRITIPNSITSVGDEPFRSCSGLIEINCLPDNPNFSVMDGVLLNKDKTELYLYPPGKQGSYTIPNSVKIIKRVAFFNCLNLTGSLVLPNSVTSIEQAAFMDCWNLTSLVVSNSVDVIGRQAFMSCGFTSIDLGNSVTTIEGSAFYTCSKLKGSLLIPNSVKVIKYGAFGSCPLTSLILGNSISEIQEYAFSNTEIKSVSILNTVAPTISANTFNSNPTILVPYLSINNYKNAPIWNTFTIIPEKRVDFFNLNAGGLAGGLLNAGYGPLSSITHIKVTGNINNVDIIQMRSKMTSLVDIDLSGVTLPDNSLPDNSFRDITRYFTIKLPSSLKSIGNNAFSGCVALTEIPLPSDVMTIGNNAFSGCVALTGDIPLSANVVSIGRSAYSGCSQLSGNLRLSKSLAAINDSAFYGCSSLSGELNIPNSVSYIGNFAFYRCTGLSGELKIPNSVSYIGNFAFFYCRGFTGSLSLPSSITAINYCAFSSCEGLSGILSIPNSVVTIGSSSFSGCLLISKIVLPSTIVSIADHSFASCSALSGSIYIPSSLISIGDNAFYGCSLSEFSVDKGNVNYSSIDGVLFNKNATKLIQYPGNKEGSYYVVPSSVTELSDYAFSYSVKLSSITIPSPISSIGYFWGCRVLNYINLPSSTTSIVDRAFKYLDNVKKISINRMIPLNINALTFEGVNKESCVLEVPIGASYAYQTTNFWSDFIFVEEKNFDTPTGVYLLTNREMKVYPAKSGVVVESVSSGDLVEMFTITGLKVNSVRSAGEKIFFPAKSGNTYLVKTASKTMKVVL